MSAPDVDLASVAHLAFDLTPACEARHAAASRPPAQLWIQMHECTGVALCIPCHQYHVDRVTAILEWAHHIHCGWCNRPFASYQTLVTRVMPI